MKLFAGLFLIALLPACGPHLIGSANPAGNSAVVTGGGGGSGASGIEGLPDNGATGGWLSMASNALLLHFNESSWNGTAAEVVDSSGSANHGRAYGAVTSTAGVSNGAGLFTGGTTATGISVPHAASLNLGTNFTYAFWMKPSAAFSGSSNAHLGLLDKGPLSITLNPTDGKLHATALDNGALTASASAFNGTRDIINALVEYKGHLYAASGKATNLGEIRVCNPAADGTCPAANWVVSLSQATTGTGYMLALGVHNGALYAGGGIAAGNGRRLFVCRTPSGASGECVSADWSANVFGGPNVYAVNSIASFNGRLYVGTGVQGADHSQVWVCATPTGPGGTCASGDWAASYTSAVTGSNTRNEMATSLLAYKGNLYMTEGLGGGSKTARVFVCTPTGGADGKQCQASDWALSYSDASAQAPNLATALAEYNGRLYAGLFNDTLGMNSIAVCNPSGPAGQCLPGDWTLSINSTVSATVGYGICSLAAYGGRLFAGGCGGGGYDKIYVCTLPAGGQCATADWNVGTHVYSSANAGSITIGAMQIFNGRLYWGEGADFTGDDDIRYFSIGRDVTSTTTTWPASWTHVGVTYDGNTMRLYVNGTLENSVAGPFTPLANSLPLWIGRTWGSPGAGQATPALDGLMDELALFSRPLSATEMQTIYQKQH